ncbi:MAG TPA: hypothetical protein VIG49_09675, partial [Acetobacteraceae bacterium]
LPDLQEVAAQVAGGRSAGAIQALRQLDQRLAERGTEAGSKRAIMRARSNIVAMRETLTQHSAYFDGEVSA